MRWIEYGWRPTGINGDGERFMTNVAVVGAAGYAGIEAVRLVLSHDRLRLTFATSTADDGKPVSAVYPALEGLTDLAFSLPHADAIASAADVALLAVPHTAAPGQLRA